MSKQVICNSEETGAGAKSVHAVTIRVAENDYRLLKMVSVLRDLSVSVVVVEAVKETLSDKEKEMLSAVGLM